MIEVQAQRLRDTGPPHVSDALRFIVSNCKERESYLKYILKVPPSSVESVERLLLGRMGGHGGILLTDTQPGVEKGWGRIPADQL